MYSQVLTSTPKKVFAKVEYLQKNMMFVHYDF
jgi:hypothetical protein